MANIEDSTIGLPIKSAPDYIFEGEDLVQDDSILSDAVALGRTQNALDLIVEVGTEITLAATGVITITWNHGATFATKKTLYTYTAPGGGGTIAAGTELVRFTLPSDLPTEGKVEVAVTDLAVTGTVNAYPILISR